LLLKRRQDNNGEEKWELPGGLCYPSQRETVEQVLRYRVQQETGLHVRKVLGQLRARPLVSSRWQEVGSRGVVVLPYEVSVEEAAVNVQEGVEWR